MADEQTIQQNQFRDFLKKRNSKTNASLQEAQKLINLYRVLNVFGDSFVEEYNNMLLNASDETHMAMKALVAGAEVRQYLEFLKEQRSMTEDNVSPERKNSPKMGYLPSPEEDERWDNVSESKGISEKEWQSFVVAQEEKMKQLMETLKAEQQATLSRLVDQLSMSQKARAEAVAPPKPESPPPRYSEIIEEKNRG